MNRSPNVIKFALFHILHIPILCFFIGMLQIFRRTYCAQWFFINHDHPPKNWPKLAPPRPRGKTRQDNFLIATICGIVPHNRLVIYIAPPSLHKSRACSPLNTACRAVNCAQIRDSGSRWYYSNFHDCTPWSARSWQASRYRLAGTPRLAAKVLPDALPKFRAICAARSAFFADSFILFPSKIQSRGIA